MPTEIDDLISKLTQAEKNLRDTPGSLAVEAAEVLASYRQLVTAFTKFPDEQRRKWVAERGYHTWTKAEIMKYPRFMATPYSFYGIVDVPSFMDKEVWVTGSNPSEGIEIMDILPGFGVAGFSLSVYMVDWIKVWTGVTEMTPEQIKPIED